MNAADRDWFRRWWARYGLPRDLINTFGAQQWVANGIEYAAARAFAQGLRRGRAHGLAAARVTFAGLRCNQHLVDDFGQEFVVEGIRHLHAESVTLRRLRDIEAPDFGNNVDSVGTWTRAEFEERGWRRVR